MTEASDWGTAKRRLNAARARAAKSFEQYSRHMREVEEAMDAMVAAAATRPRRTQPGRPVTPTRAPDVASNHALKLHDIGEAAELLGCSSMHIYRLIAAGELRAVDIALPGAGRSKTRVRSDDMDDYVQRKAGSAPRPN